MKEIRKGVVPWLVAAVTAWCAVGAVLRASGEDASLEERFRGAQRVVVATARTVEPTWRQNEHGDRLIVSRIVLDVDETLKGAPESLLALDLEGGTIDGLTLRVSDLPEIRPGERGVFFLTGNGAAALTPHRRGAGILMLDDTGAVRGSGLRLADLRRMASAARK